MKWLLSFFIVLFLIPITKAWYGSYGFRYPIINSYTTSDYPIAVNDTSGISGTIIWSYINNASYLYCSISGCESGSVLIANDTDQKYWENETSLSGNSPESVWDSGYVAVWHLNSTTDSTSNSNDLTNNGAVQTTGIFGTAYWFDGNDDDIHRTINEDLKCLENCTVEAWVYPDDYKGSGASGTYPSIVTTARDSDNKQSLDFYAHSSDDGVTGAFAFQYVNTDVSFTTCESGTATAQDEWFHIVGVNNITHLMLYINGELNKTCTHGKTPNNLTANFMVGKFGWSEYPRVWDGIIDEVRISNRTRTAEEIRQAYYNGIRNLTTLGSEEIKPLSPTETKLFLNGTENNVYYANESDANFTVLVNVSGTVHLETNITGWVTINGSSPFSNFTTLTATTNETYYNITGYFPLNATHEASSQTYYAIIYSTVPTTTTTTIPEITEPTIVCFKTKPVCVKLDDFTIYLFNKNLINMIE